ncbi:MAG: polysaccharide deacetylase family protein [Anaerolineae bacterium]
MKLREWFDLRGPKYVRQRAAVLLDRYGVAPAKATKRVDGFVATLAEYGCAPTFPTPGRVVQRHSHYFRHLQDSGVEIAVHGFDHVDLNAYPPAEASKQLARAADVFADNGIEVHGFRCPYLSCTDDLVDCLPKGVFKYSSNEAIWWDGCESTIASSNRNNRSTVFETLLRFYQPRSAQDAVCVPWARSGTVEIPLCVPDDLQLHDGLLLGPEGIAQAWSQVLKQTYRRGELYTLNFHPELASLCKQPIIVLVHEAKRLQPPVWIARLRDISDWWQEKSGFRVEVSHTSTGLHISFTCSERATILVRGLGPCGSEHARCPEPVEGWDGAYYQLRTKALYVPAEPRPFVGLPANAPKGVVSFLREQGYILDTGETATRCGTYIDPATMDRLTSEVKLIDYIEASTGPLVRYWRWPSGAKSAMCVTGDLDALTLLDYASRLFAR